MSGRPLLFNTLRQDVTPSCPPCAWAPSAAAVAILSARMTTTMPRKMPRRTLLTIRGSEPGRVRGGRLVTISYQHLFRSPLWRPRSSCACCSMVGCPIRAVKCQRRRAACVPRTLGHVCHLASSMATRFVNGEQDVIGGANGDHARIRPDLQLKSWLLHLSTATIALKPPLVSADTEGGVRRTTGRVQPTGQVKEVAQLLAEDVLHLRLELLKFLPAPLILSTLRVFDELV